MKSGNLETWVKPLADGSIAVGVVNMDSKPAEATVSAADLKLTGKLEARDLWAHRPVNFTDGTDSAEVPAHGTLLLKLSTK